MIHAHAAYFLTFYLTYTDIYGNAKPDFNTLLLSPIMISILDKKKRASVTKCVTSLNYTVRLILLFSFLNKIKWCNLPLHVETERINATAACAKRLICRSTTTREHGSHSRHINITNAASHRAVAEVLQLNRIIFVSASRPSLIRGSFTHRSVKLTSCLHPRLRLRMHQAGTPLSVPLLSSC